MKKKWQFYLWFILILFLMPFITINIPAAQPDRLQTVSDSGKLVYAANLFDFEVDQEETAPAPELSGQALMYFTHSHEAFAPILKEKEGKIAVSHSKENIMDLGESFTSHFRLNGINLDVLDYDNVGQMSEARIHYSKAYQVIRPRLQEQLKAKSYDVILDIHRDSLGRSKTTVQGRDGQYAKVYFVIGENHPGHAANRRLSEQISVRMNELVPGISKGTIGKSGHGVDGVYNQDLSPNVILVEMGGTENTEDELNRTIAIVAKATAEVLGGR